MTTNPTAPQDGGEKLAACPFCGGSDIRFDCHPNAGRGPIHYGEDVWSMCCYNCGATFPNMYSKGGLVSKWNTRATPGMTAVRNEALEKAVTAARDAMVAQEWPPQDGDVQIEEVLAAIRALKQKGPSNG